MAKKKTSWFNVENTDRKKWIDVCPENTWRILKPEDIPDNPVPQDFWDKCDSVFVMVSGSEDGLAFCMANANRIDEKNPEIDQQPFCLAFLGDDPAPSGILIHHGDWKERSIPIPNDFYSYFRSSGIQEYYPLSQLPQNSSGSIDDLNIQGQHDAIWKGIYPLKKFLEDLDESSD